MLLVSRQGKVRLSRFYETYDKSTQAKMTQEVTQKVLKRRSKMCNFLEWREGKLIYKRYASLCFILYVDNDENELQSLEIIHHFVEILDRYFGNVCELDIIFNFHRAYFILDELLLAGALQESSKKQVLKSCAVSDILMSPEVESVPPEKQNEILQQALKKSNLL
jgi:AP-1 complex subunit sigma 1/2